MLADLIDAAGYIATESCVVSNQIQTIGYWWSLDKISVYFLNVDSRSKWGGTIPAKIRRSGRMLSGMQSQHFLLWFVKEC